MKLPRLLFLIVLAFAAPALAQDATLDLVGVNGATVAISPKTVAGLPVIEREVVMTTSKGQSTARYKGVLLWDVLRTTGGLEPLKPAEQLGRTFMIIGKDGYAIAFSIGEIHPDFGNLQAILVGEIDGRPLEGNWRIIVPGDKRGARSVRDVARIELR